MHVVPGSPHAAVRHLLSVSDLDPDEIGDALDSALTLKAGSPAWIGRAGPLARKHVALLFDKPSLRTRVSFEVGIGRLGGATTTLTASDVGLGARESYADIARTLSRYVDAIVIRMHSHSGLVELAGAAEVPVVNALTEREHPCQALADLLTLREHLGELKGRRLVFVGDGNNVCHSLLLGGAAVGMHVRVVTPRGHAPDAEILQEAALVGRRSGAPIEVVHDPVAAVEGADAVYTDVWASMGSEHEALERRRTFAPFQVNAELLRAAPDALVMHCLPAHRGEEIAADVLDGPTSVVFDQAENRMWAQQAVLLHLLRAHRIGRAATHAVAEPAPLRPALAGVAALRP